MVSFVAVARVLRVLCFAVLATRLAGCWNTPPATPPAPAPPQTWLMLSDVHFNPFDDPSLVQRLVQAPVADWHAILASSPRPPSPYFDDTNFALFESALAAMRKTLPNPPVVVIAGDFMGHMFPERFARNDPGAPPSVYQQFVDKTIAFLASEFEATYPSAQFLIAIGNNDGYCGDYMSTPDSPFLAHMAAAWEPLVDRNGAAPQFVSEFSKSGHYTATLPSHPAMPAIVLNSIFWSSLYENRCGARGTDPGKAELSWFGTQLGASRSQPLLLTHIPPGIDEYASDHDHTATPLYKETDTEYLLALLRESGVSPRAFVMGHIHHATFEIANTAAGQLGAISLPSISPNQGNNPAFVVALVGSASPTIADTTTYALSLAAPGPWQQLYAFNAAYGLQGFDAASLLQLQARIAGDATARARFFDYYGSASAVATPSPATWPWYFCGHGNLTVTPYAACVKRSK